MPQMVWAAASPGYMGTSQPLQAIELHDASGR